MKQVLITLPDGSARSYDSPTTPSAVAASIGKRLESASVAAKINGKESDLTTPIEADCEVALITRDSAEGLEVIRHSTAHLLAHAIKELYPDTQITIGPVIEDGFYYDVDPKVPLTPDDLPKLEKRMAEIASRDLSVHREVWQKEKAVEFFKGQKELFKAEIIEDLNEPSVSVYRQGDFTDLCRGPHVPSTGRLGKFKLLSIAGAYWRGNENNPMLQRIYGTAFATQKELDAHIQRIEEAKKRDHRKLGPEMELFQFLPVAPAMPFYLPKGTQLASLLRDYIRKETESLDYMEVVCPQLMNTELWQKSGHLDHYRENMFFTESGDGSTQMSLKPMNCPGHAVLFGTRKHSYRELPIRYSEYSQLHRNERAGVTHGLFRTRAFSQDDGHIFCREDQILSESLSTIEAVLKVYGVMGFQDIEIKLATRPESSMGTDEQWEKATKALQEALQEAKQEFVLIPGEGAFYGPKIEFHVRDCLNRLWQCGTIQLDFSLPQRFELEYVDSNNEAQNPVMIHRAIFGSLERFMGILIEHHGGHLPLWLCPTQATVINLQAEQQAYATKVAQEMRSWGMRIECDFRNEKLGYRIREAQMKKVPWMVILGPKEAEAKQLSLREWTGENLSGLSLSQTQSHFAPLTKPGGSSH